MGLRHGSLFSGIGMIDYGLELAGFRTAWQVEIDPYCQAVLRKHWPGVPLYGDVKECGSGREHELERVDLVSGGFPCTDISIAGHGPGIGTPDSPTKRSGLWYEFHRIVREMRPRWAVIENVARLLHTDDGAGVIFDMEKEGYACWPFLLGSHVIGAPHERRRAWIVCRDNHSHGDCDTGAGVGQGQLPDNLRRAFEEAVEKEHHWKCELAAGDDGTHGPPEEPEPAAYSRGVRRVHDDSHWVDRLRCCGNSVIWFFPAVIGAYIAQAGEGGEDGDRGD